MKTGLHINRLSSLEQVQDYYRRSGATTIKTLDANPDLLAWARGERLDTIIRIYNPDQKLTDKGFVHRCVEMGRAYPWAMIEGMNEDFQDNIQLARYAEWEIDRMKALEVVGAKAVIGSFSTGMPDFGGWTMFRPALEYAAAHGHYLGLHEYSGPFMQWMAGKNQWWGGNPVTGDPADGPGVSGWTTLRYRKVHDLLDLWGLGHLSILITESGIDDVQPRPGQQGKGYKDFRDWVQLGDYADQRRWYSGHLTRDSYIAGVVDFGFQTADPAWGSFDLSTDPAMMNRLIRAESDLPPGHIASPPVAPPPPPVPTPTADVWPAVTVKAGEGWMSVARRCGVPTALLKQANSVNLLHPGTILRVPLYRCEKVNHAVLD